MVKTIHRRIGCPAPFSAVQVGGGSSAPGSDVFFVDGDKKVRSIRRVLGAETQQELGDAVSLPLQDVLDRINQTWISRCVAFYHNDHYILAFPKAGSTRPDSVVAYNLLTQSWCGEWTGWEPTAFAMRTDSGDYSKLIWADGWDGAAMDGRCSVRRRNGTPIRMMWWRCRGRCSYQDHTRAIVWRSVLVQDRVERGIWV